MCAAAASALTQEDSTRQASRDSPQLSSLRHSEARRTASPPRRAEGPSRQPSGGARGGGGGGKLSIDEGEERRDRLVSIDTGIIKPFPSIGMTKPYLSM